MGRRTQGRLAGGVGVRMLHYTLKELGAESRAVFLTAAELARRCHLSSGWVRSSLRHLVDAGVVDLIYHQGFGGGLEIRLIGPIPESDPGTEMSPKSYSRASRKEGMVGPGKRVRLKPSLLDVISDTQPYPLSGGEENANAVLEAPWPEPPPDAELLEPPDGFSPPELDWFVSPDPIAEPAPVVALPAAGQLSLLAPDDEAVTHPEEACTRRSGMPVPYLVNAVQRQMAADAGMPPAILAVEFQKYQACHIAKGSKFTKAGWEWAAWRTWLARWEGAPASVRVHRAAAKKAGLDDLDVGIVRAGEEP